MTKHKTDCEFIIDMIKVFIKVIWVAIVTFVVIAYCLDMIHSSSQGREENHTDCDTHTALSVRTARLSTPIVASDVRAQKAPSTGSVASSCR